MTGDIGEELTIPTKVIVNKGDSNEVQLGQKVMRYDVCGLNTFEDVMWFRPYVHLATIIKLSSRCCRSVTPFLQGTVT